MLSEPLQKVYVYFDDLTQNCSNSMVDALELLQYCTKPLIWYSSFAMCFLCGYYAENPYQHVLLIHKIILRPRETQNIYPVFQISYATSDMIVVALKNQFK